MRPILMALLACCILIPCPALAAPDYPAIALRCLTAASHGDFDRARADFDVAMTFAMSADRFTTVWGDLVRQYGAFQRFGAPSNRREGAYVVVILPCRFAKVSMDARVVLTEAGRISGLWFTPGYETAPYADPGHFITVDVTAGAEGWPLPGTLCLPKGKGPFPAVVLVHGSGPLDRDETIGVNKPFRDLAEGLATRGIAVLRYDKRTLTHRDRTLRQPGFTVKEETIDDAIAGVALLKQRAEIDPARVYVLGHSLGGMLVPRIGAAAPRIAGFIILAGNTRPIAGEIVRQAEYLATLHGTLTVNEQNELELIRQTAARTEARDLDPATPAAQLFGTPGSYWLDLRGYRPHVAATALTQPLFILQGARDYQVPSDCLTEWQRALAGRKQVRYRLYAHLNHLFMPGEGQPRPEEYQVAGHVAAGVIDDLAAWIGGRQ